MYTLGLNAYHGDSSACIYRDTELIAATEEERIRRIKHWAGLPTEAIKFCLQEAGITLDEVDYITVSRDPKAKFAQKALFAVKNGIGFSNIQDRLKNSFSIRRLKDDLAESLGFKSDALKAEVQFIEHHRSHMASAFHISPFEESAILTIDGMGDFTSTMRGYGKGNKIEVFDSVSYPHSIGMFYTTFTQYLGFPHYGDEYKVMGLSPYGQAKYVDKVRDVVIQKKNGLFELNDKYFRHFKDGVAMSWNGGAPTIGPMYTDYLVEQFGPLRQKGEKLTQYHMDLAASVQRYCEELIFFLAEGLYQKTGAKRLCIAGGVAQNSVANGKLVANTSFEQLFVPPAGHDAGTSVGSALYFLHHVKDQPRRPFHHQAYTGVKVASSEIENFLKDRGINYTRYDEDQLIEVVSEKLLGANVIGWYQGRAEFGPRALGNRSIIVDPRRDDAKALLNEKIKKRESFRPFAPSIIKEAVDEYFEQADSVPFMEKVFQIKKEKHEVIPAVTHVDGTGRLQTVEQQDNPRYYQLIKRFGEKSGVPIVLNTSFNENEPIVNLPEHALDCFLRTKMDVLVLEDCVIERASN
ncbi:MAG: carbamoyltransferase C-terminal domain-containing protein [Bacteroidota bacterium]